MVGIIGFNSLKIMQYLCKYTEVLDKHNIEYEVIFWNRDKENIDLPMNYISFNYETDTYKSFFRKIFSFLKYTRFLYKVIENKKYDKLILLTTQTIIPLFPLVLSKYKEKYIYDYRDITFEKHYLYKLIVRKLIKNSSFTSISSPGFVSTIGKSSKYIMSHNCHNFKIKHITRSKHDTINIVYWGMVRQVEYNKKVCDLFGNDIRFKLIYHGEGYYKELQAYCESKGYSNVIFTGTYNPSSIEKFVENTDVLLNVYENDEQQKPALTVKLYDGIRYMLPILVTKGSYMENFIEKYNISFPLALEKGVSLDNLYKWIKDLDRTKFANNYKLLYEKITEDNRYFEDKLFNFVRERYD